MDRSWAIFLHGSGGVKTALKIITVHGWERQDLAYASQEVSPSHMKTDPTGNTASEVNKATLGSYMGFPFKRHYSGKESEHSNTTLCWESLQDMLKQQSVVKASLTKVPETCVYWIKSEASE